MFLIYKDILKDGKGSDFVIFDISFDSNIFKEYFLEKYFEKIIFDKIKNPPKKEGLNNYLFR